MYSSSKVLDFEAHYEASSNTDVSSLNAQQMMQMCIDKADSEITELKVQQALLKQQLDDVQRKIWAKQRMVNEAKSSLVATP